MKKSMFGKTHPDLAGVGAALTRAAADARRLADDTDTPFIVFIDGEIVNLRQLELESVSHDKKKAS